MKLALAIIISLAIGFATGWFARSPSSATSAPMAASVDRPSDDEATAAFRRSQRALGPSTATIRLQDCVRSRTGPGVQCTAQLFPTPTSKPIAQSYGFARIAGQWEIAG